MRLEIGPGPERLGDDWTTVSAVPGPAVDYLAEWGLDELPFHDESVDVLYACHVIEHIGWMHVEAALLEAWRVLRPGGVIELHTVDAVRMFSHLLSGSLEEDPLDDPWRSVNYRLFCYPKIAGDRACANWHHSFHDPASLQVNLERCGFVDVERVAEARGPDKHGAYSFGVRGVRK